MTRTEFHLFLQHFIENVRPSKERPVLLLLDNHSSHLLNDGLNIAKDNGVVMFVRNNHLCLYVKVATVQ